MKSWIQLQIAIVITLCAGNWEALAQPSPQVLVGDARLRIDLIQSITGNRIRLEFTDTGTGASTYRVESVPRMGNDLVWSETKDAVLTSLQAGRYRFELVAAEPKSLFLRLLAVLPTDVDVDRDGLADAWERQYFGELVQGPNGDFDGDGYTQLQEFIAGTDPTNPASKPGFAVAQFAQSSFEVDEGAGITNVPIRLSAPFQGNLFYTLGGTARSTGDYKALSGQVAVNGTLANIPLEILDDAEQEGIEWITLRLLDDVRYGVGAIRTVTIHVVDNEAKWVGMFECAKGRASFDLRVTRSGGVVEGKIESDGQGLFPNTGTNGMPVVMQWSAVNFNLDTGLILIPVEQTQMGAAQQWRFQCNAQAGLNDQSISRTLVQGHAQLTVEPVGSSALKTVISGRFALQKSPPAFPKTRPSYQNITGSAVIGSSATK